VQGAIGEALQAGVKPGDLLRLDPDLALLSSADKQDADVYQDFALCRISALEDQAFHGAVDKKRDPGRNWPRPGVS
jgi:hypothetical protein